MSFLTGIDVSAQAADPSTVGVDRQPPSRISVLVVGGGPVGVYTALQCWRKGHDVRIIERGPSASTQG
jgi:NADPH-dependent 2,4-dienoyl-CoA reductase/sulfur reductase-like enzyme